MGEAVAVLRNRAESTAKKHRLTTSPAKLSKIRLLDRAIFSLLVAVPTVSLRIVSGVMSQYDTDVLRVVATGAENTDNVCATYNPSINGG